MEHKTQEKFFFYLRQFFCRYSHQYHINAKKGKAIQLQAWKGPEGSRRLRFPDFKTIGTWWW